MLCRLHTVQSHEAFWRLLVQKGDYSNVHRRSVCMLAVTSSRLLVFPSPPYGYMVNFKAGQENISIFRKNGTSDQAAEMVVEFIKELCKQSCYFYNWCLTSPEQIFWQRIDFWIVWATLQKASCWLSQRFSSVLINAALSAFKRAISVFFSLSFVFSLQEFVNAGVISSLWCIYSDEKPFVDYNGLWINTWKLNLRN